MSKISDIRDSTIISEIKDVQDQIFVDNRGGNRWKMFLGMKMLFLQLEVDDVDEGVNNSLSLILLFIVD